jgi:hypothetical protein
MSDHHSAAHASPDDDYRVTPSGAEYEHTDADTRTIGRSMAWLLLVVVLTHGLIWGIYKAFVWQNTSTVEPQFPLAVRQGPRLPPEPRLQADPQTDIRAFRAEEDALLSSYGWVDRSTGTVHIPIEEGMRLAVERALRARPGAVQTEATGLEGVGAMPSDASAGRQPGRRRQ